MSFILYKIRLKIVFKRKKLHVGISDKFLEEISNFAYICTIKRKT